MLGTNQTVNSYPPSDRLSHPSMQYNTRYNMPQYNVYMYVIKYSHCSNTPVLVVIYSHFSNTPVLVVVCVGVEYNVVVVD